MKKPYKHPFPFPKENHPGPWMFSDIKEVYPFPVPSVELFEEYEWPKSLCQFADSCLAEDVQDLDTAKECVNASRYGCPLFLTQFSEFQEFGECKNVQIFALGQTESKDYKEKDLEKIVENFKKLNETHRPPMVVLGHGEDQGFLQKSGLPAAGWVTNLWVKGKKLYADFKDVPKQVVKVIKKGAYKFPSVEIYRNFMYNNESFGPVLRRVALLGADIPRIKSLNDVAARYEEFGEGSFCLPVVQSDENWLNELNSELNDDQNINNQHETLWLGGETMKKLSIPIKEGSKDFKVGEELLLGDNVIGTLTEFEEHEFTLETDLELTFEEGQEIVGKESEAKAVIGEPQSVGDPEQFASYFFELEKVKGNFKAGEKITGKDSKVLGTVKKVLSEGLVIDIPPDNLYREGELLSGADSEATAMVAKYPSPYKRPYPYPLPSDKKQAQKVTLKSEKDPSKDADLIALQSKMSELESEIKAKDAKIAKLGTHAEEQDKKIQKTDEERSEEKRAAHLQDISRWAEELKRNGLAPAIVDEGSLMGYAIALDWQVPILFAEGEDKKTPWMKFSEMMNNLVDSHKEGKLFVPLDELGQIIETNEIIPVGVDADGAKLDKEISKYAEDHKMTYEEAFSIITNEKKI